MFAPQTCLCRKVDLTDLNHDVFRIHLQWPVDVSPLRFAPGQYLSLRLPSGEALSYSIAGVANAGGLIELHVRRQAEQAASIRVVEYLKAAAQVEVTLPMGECILTQEAVLKKETPLIILAGSTGFSQAKSLLEGAWQLGLTHTRLYWGARRQPDLYLESLPRQWQREQAGFHFRAVLSDVTLPADDNYVSGLLPQALLADLPKPLPDARVYLCGSPAMVYAVMDALLATGWPSGCFHSDVFQYAPR